MSGGEPEVATSLNPEVDASHVHGRFGIDIHENESALCLGNDHRGHGIVSASKGIGARPPESTDRL
jgi:hypothetical protein